MGNQLCAPWRKVYQDDENHWTPRKDSHLLRLWAEIFEVQEEDGEICWGKVSDDVVPVNITCIQNQPLTVFQITAYNRHVEKIFDVRLSQPGTRITQASECFVHWKDSKLDHEWGLNFTTPLDARRFRECCSKNYGRKSISNPTSPVAQPRRAISSPEELAGQDDEASSIYAGGALKADDLSHYSQVSGIATAPRVHKNARQFSHCQSMYSTVEGVYNGSGIHCENIYSQITRQHRLQEMTAEECSHHHQNLYSGTMHQPIAEREIPYAQFISTKNSTAACNIYVTNQQMKAGLFSYAGVKSDNPGQSGSNFSAGHARASSVGRCMHAEAHHLVSPGLLTPEGSKVFESLRAEGLSKSLKDVRGSPKERDHKCPENSELRYVDKTGECAASKMSGIELRQFSREPTVLNFANARFEDGRTKLDEFSDSSLISQAAKQLRSSNKKMARSDNHLASSEEEEEPKQEVIKRLANEDFRQKQAFGKMDIAPGFSASNIEGIFSVGFDSNTLKRMLQVLPDASPIDQSGIKDKYILESPNKVLQSITSPVNPPLSTPTTTTPLQSTTSVASPSSASAPSILQPTSSGPVVCPSDSTDAVSISEAEAADKDEASLPWGLPGEASMASASTKTYYESATYTYSVSDLRNKFLPPGTPTTRTSQKGANVVPSPSSSSSSPLPQPPSTTSVVPLLPLLAPPSSSSSSSTSTTMITTLSAPDHGLSPEAVSEAGLSGTPADSMAMSSAQDFSEIVECTKDGVLVDAMTSDFTQTLAPSSSFVPVISSPTTSLASSISSLASHAPVVTAIRHPIMSTTSIASSHQSVNFSTISSAHNPHELISQSSSFSSSSSSAIYPTYVETEHQTRVPGDDQQPGKPKSSTQPGLFILPFETQAMFASRSTSIRKAGCLMVQNFLSHKMSTVFVSSKRVWREFFVCLKGTLLLFFGSEEEAGRMDCRPCHVLVISGCLAYPDEKSQVEGLFSLSTIFGNAYLLKAPSAEEMFGWIVNLHLACAACLARNLNRENVCRLLKNEIHKLENSIDLDLKMKKMAGMQANLVSDVSMKQVLDRQMNAWDENLERLYMEQFQLRCYLTAVQDTELPSSEALISNMSNSTRTALASLGIESATSFHTAVCSRVPLTMTANLCLSKRSHQSQGMSTFKADSKNKPPRYPRPLSFQPSAGSDNVVLDGSSSRATSNWKQSDASKTSAEPTVHVNLPDGQVVTVGLNDKTTFQELLECITSQCQFNSSLYFIRLKLPGEHNFKIPEKSSYVLSEDCTELELCAKLLFQIEIVRNWKEKDLGFTVECKEDSKNEEDLCVVIADVAKNSSMTSRKGLQIGDELLVLNGMMVNELDMVYIESILEESDVVSMTLRSCRCIERDCQNLSSNLETQDEHLEQVSSQDFVTSENSLTSSDIVLMPSSTFTSQMSDPGAQMMHSCNNPVWIADSKYQGIQNDRPVLPSSILMNKSYDEEVVKHTTARSMTDAEKTCKVILELIETERQYVQDLNCLIDWYLEPLKNERIAGSDDVEQLFGNIQEIVHFQKMFLQSLEGAVDKEIGPHTNPNRENIHFKKILLALGSAFLYYAHHFKLYSSFCASHSKAQKILLSDSNIPLQDFLKSHNPMQQHSVALESYLIKPIQRILKYPLLLKQLKDLTEQSSEEHAHLREALHGMEAVAEHINEMQKIYEEYGCILDELSKQFRENNPHSRSLDLNVGELQMYGTVNWLNATSELGKLKKGMELLTLLFIFRSGVVLMAQEKIKGKRKVKGRLAPSLGDVTNGGLSSGGAKYKTAIPVDQLQVRTMVGDAHECHGIWEMIHCGSEYDGRMEKIYQFASSQEARRDFIRTIHFSIRENLQQPKQSAYNHLSTKSLTPDVRSKSVRAPSNDQGARHVHYSRDTEPQSQVKQTSSQRMCQQPKNLKQSSQARYDLPSELPFTSTEGPTRLEQRLPETIPAEYHHHYETSTLSTVSHRNPAAILQTGAARLVQTSNEHTRYSSQTLQHQTREPHRPGSPVWKPRSGTMCTTNQSPSIGDICGHTISEIEAPTTTTAPQKQRVAFLIPNKYKEFEDTDC